LRPDSGDRCTQDETEVLRVVERPTSVAEHHGPQPLDRVVAFHLKRRPDRRTEAVEPVADEQLEQTVAAVDVSVEAGRTDLGSPGDLPEGEFRSPGPPELDERGCPNLRQ
jgi:hypothetical protein